MFPIEKIRKDFPTLNQSVNDEPLIYLDNAATTQKPLQVMEAMKHFYEWDNANVHRGVHALSERATSAYESARDTVCRFIGAHSPKEIIFTRGTTTSLNWIATGFGDLVVESGDEIIISKMDHHANVVPWQQLAKRKGAKLKYVRFDEDGKLDLEHYDSLLSSRTKIVSIAHASNVLGVINPIKEMAKMAHDKGAYFVVDGAQSVPHESVDVQDLDCDFFAFSGHKMCGPTGIGVLYGKEELLEQMEPVEFGGEMIDFVYDNESTWTELPWKFEAGTPNIAGAIGLQAAIRYLEKIGMWDIKAYEQELVEFVLPQLEKIKGVTVYGPQDPCQHTGVISFNIDGIHPHDVATALDMEGIAVRAGHHCAQPLMRELEIPASVRASFYFYNTKEEANQLIQSILLVKEYFNDGFI